MKIAGVVVLYNPDREVAFNIGRYVHEIDVLYVIDNSENKNHDLIRTLKKWKNVLYIDNGENKGIAHALNRGACLAVKQGYDWLLTMDQDSRVDDNMLTVMKRYIVQNDTGNIGILAPKILHEDGRNKNAKVKPFDRDRVTPLSKAVVITSGNLLNLKAYVRAGKFLNQLFVDAVDIEYCFRLKTNHYRIIEINHAKLYQTYGNRSKANGIEAFHYPPIRYYYQVRNGLFVSNAYKKTFPRLSRDHMEHLVKNRLIPAIVFEDNKITKICYMLRGLIDYKVGRYGRLRGFGKSKKRG